jgi:hypothetical protein
MTKNNWKKHNAEKTLRAIRQLIEEHFHVQVPDISLSNYGGSWEWQIEHTEVWTKAGPAKLSIQIDHETAHMYFAFHNPKRAIPFDDHLGRLNRHSGKWNRIASACDYENPEDSLDVFQVSLKRDFIKVAEPNPDPIEFDAHERYKAEENARWARLREEWATQIA